MVKSLKEIIELFFYQKKNKRIFFPSSVCLKATMTCVQYCTNLQSKYRSIEQQLEVHRTNERMKKRMEQNKGRPLGCVAGNLIYCDSKELELQHERSPSKMFHKFNVSLHTTEELVSFERVIDGLCGQEDSMGTRRALSRKKPTMMV